MRIQPDAQTTDAADKRGAQGTLAATVCYALAVVMSKVTSAAFGYTTTTRLVLGYRKGPGLSQDEATGSFLRECFKNNDGFQAGEVVSIIVPLAEA